MNLILVSHLIYRPIETFLERKLHFCTSGCVAFSHQPCTTAVVHINCTHSMYVWSRCKTHQTHTFQWLIIFNVRRHWYWFNYYAICYWYVQAYGQFYRYQFMINLWQKRTETIEKKPNAFGQQHQGEKNCGTNSKWQPMNKCTCVDYMVCYYDLLTIENWQRKKVNAAKKQNP